jgi:hypothetical protein
MSPDTLILEGLVTTQDAAGNLRVAPMGPRVDRSLTELILRPFETSQSGANLVARRAGVFQVVDDVLLLAQAAIGRWPAPPEVLPTPQGNGFYLPQACRWFAFRVTAIEPTAPRITLRCQVVERGELQPFLGFCRAKHAVVEAAILATRIGILPTAEIASELARLKIWIEKTAGAQERTAFALLEAFIAEQTPG